MKLHFEIYFTRGLHIMMFIFVSCGSKNLDYDGDFVKVESKSLEYGVYTFDFNNTLHIEFNGDNYLITEAGGNKFPANWQDGILKVNSNCTLFIDKSENVLVQSCTNGGNISSNDYWPRKRVEEYLSKPKGEINYPDYVNAILFDGFRQDFKVAKIESLNMSAEYLNGFIPDSIKTSNPYYPMMAFGDFNGDKKLPDIATLIKIDKADINSVNGAKLIVFHAGQRKPTEIRGFFCKWITSETNRRLESHWEPEAIKKKSDGIVSVCLEKSAKVFYWDGRRYTEYWISD